MLTSMQRLGGGHNGSPNPESDKLHIQTLKKGRAVFWVLAQWAELLTPALAQAPLEAGPSPWWKRRGCSEKGQAFQRRRVSAPSQKNSPSATISHSLTWLPGLGHHRRVGKNGIGSLVALASPSTRSIRSRGDLVISVQGRAPKEVDHNQQGGITV